METTANLLAHVAVILLGLTAGALLAEGAILVPSWRSLPPESFLAWYKQHAGLLQNFFGPLEVAATGFTVAAATLGWLGQTAVWGRLFAAAFLAVSVLIAFPLYFKRANASFAAGTIASERVGDELARWSLWHWIRVALATAAFISGAAAL